MSIEDLPDVDDARLSESEKRLIIQTIECENTLRWVRYYADTSPVAAKRAGAHQACQIVSDANEKRIAPLLAKFAESTHAR